MPDRDLSDVRLVGTCAFAVGAMLLLLTIVTSFFLLVAGGAKSENGLAHGLLSVGLAIVMALTLIGCGGTMRAIRPGNTSDLENLRLVWTSLVLIMVLSVPAGFWLLQPLADLAVLMLLALFAIRGAVIRLTTR
jgi:hypothetical protein